MTIQGTYGSLQSQIADELGQRTDLTSQIQTAIQSAIAKYERQRFYFNQYYSQTAFYTVTGQEFYTVSDWSYMNKFVTIQKIWVTVSQNRYTLEPRTWQYLADVSVNPQVTGWPIEYAYANEQMRIYMIPNGNYPMGILATIRLDQLVNDADSNAWTTDAYDLIRCEAKRQIYADLIMDADQVAMMDRQIMGGNGMTGYLTDLRKETSSRLATPKLRPTYF